MDIMDYIVDKAQTDKQERRVVVPSRVRVALSQLDESEQAAVAKAIESMERNGLDNLPGVDVKRLVGDVPRYVLSLDDAPDVWVYARAEQGDPIEVTDIARPATVRSLFHSQQNGN